MPNGRKEARGKRLVEEHPVAERAVEERAVKELLMQGVTEMESLRAALQQVPVRQIPKRLRLRIPVKVIV